MFFYSLGLILATICLIHLHRLWLYNQMVVKYNTSIWLSKYFPLDLQFTRSYFISLVLKRHQKVIYHQLIQGTELG